MNINLFSYFIIFALAFVLKISGGRFGHFYGRKFYIIIICIVLGSISALRDLSIGPDTMSYSRMFQQIKYDDWNMLFEAIPKTYIQGNQKDPGFPILIKLFQMISSDFRLFLVAIGIAFYSALGMFIYMGTKNLRDAVFSFVLFVALFQIIALSGIRQQITTSIALFSLNYIIRKELTKFLFLVILGSTIHFSLLLIIPFYFIHKLPTTHLKHLYTLMVVFFFLIIERSREIVILMATATGNEYYLGYDGSAGTGGGTFYVSMVFLVALMGWFTRDQLMKMNEENKIYFTAIILLIFFAPLILVDASLIRVGQYFSLYMMVFIPLVANHYFTKSKLLYPAFFILCFILIALEQRSPMQYAFFWK